MDEKQTIAALGAGSISKRVYEGGRIVKCENVKDVAQTFNIALNRYYERLLGCE